MRKLHRYGCGPIKRGSSAIMVLVMMTCKLGSRAVEWVPNGVSGDSCFVCCASFAWAHKPGAVLVLRC